LTAAAGIFFSKQKSPPVLSYFGQLLPMTTNNTTSLSSNDLPMLQSSYRLNGNNYLQWAQLVRATLKGRKKLSHLEGNPPAKTDSKYEDWDDEDSLIMTWLWNSMTPEISRNCMFFSTAKEIWENLCQTYSDKRYCSMVRDRKQDLSYHPREPFSNKLLWYVEWFMDRIRSISKFEDEVHI